MKSVICVSYCKPGLGDPLTPLFVSPGLGPGRSTGYGRSVIMNMYTVPYDRTVVCVRERMYSTYTQRVYRTVQ